MRILFSGESHMEAVTAVIEGFPAGFFVNHERINRDLARRQAGYGRGDRMKIESDRVQIYSGIIEDKTIGSPITMLIPNRDSRRSTWDPGGVRTVPRPGHAEIAGAVKYDLPDLRLVAERASARHTAAWVAAGSLFAQFLEEFDIQILGMVESVGKLEACFAGDPFECKEQVEDSPFRTGSPQCDEKMKEAVDKAREEGETLGGVFRVIIRGCPPGLGTYVHPDRRLDARLAGAIMAIPTVKGVEIGAGFESAAMPGSKMHDIILTEQGLICRKTNNAGGIEGGVSNGEDIIIRAASKPIPTLGEPLPSVDISSGEAARAPYVRSDVCIMPAVSVIGEAVTARVIIEAFLERYGGDNMRQIRTRFNETGGKWNSRLFE